MRILCRLLPVILAVILAAAMVITWGSVGSVTMLLCLILMGTSLLYQHFLTNRDADDWQTD